MSKISEDNHHKILQESIAVFDQIRDDPDKTFKKSIRELEVDLNNSQTGLNNCKDEVVRKRYEILIEGYEKDLKEQKWGHEVGKKELKTIFKGERSKILGRGERI